MAFAFATAGELATRALEGDHDALILLWDRHVDRAYVVTARLLEETRARSRATAGTFALATRRLVLLDDPNDVTVWLLGLAAYEATRIRLRAPEQARPAMGDTAAPNRAALGSSRRGPRGPLAPVEQLLLELRYGQRLSPNEVARALGGNRAEIAGLLRTATTKLDRAYGSHVLIARGRRACEPLARILALAEDGPPGQPTSARLVRVEAHAGRCGRCGAFRERARPAGVRLALPMLRTPTSLRDRITGQTTLETERPSPRRARRGGWRDDGFPPPVAGDLTAGLVEDAPDPGGTSSSWSSLVAPERQLTHRRLGDPTSRPV